MLSYPPLHDEVHWCKELQSYQELDMSAYLIYLVPTLESLELICPYSTWQQIDPRGRQRPQHEFPNYSCLDVALQHTRSLKSLHVASWLPLNTLPADSLTQLTLSLLFFADRNDWSTSFSCLPNVHTLTVELNVPQLMEMDEVVTFTVHPLLGLRGFLEYAVPNIVTFSIKPCKGTDPRLGPLFDASGDEIPVISMDEDLQDVNEVTFGTRMIDEQFLLGVFHALLPVKDQLVHLTLPTNWYCSAGMGVKPMWELQLFSRLQTLCLPKLAIIANRFAQDYDPNDHDRLAEMFLPPSLQTLTITQVDLEVCCWLHSGFREAARDRNLLQHLEEVHLFFRDDFIPTVPIGFARDATVLNIRVIGHLWGSIEVVGTGEVLERPR